MTTDNSAVLETHQFLRMGEHDLYVALHVPRGRSHTSVVFCLPIHEEQKSAYRPCVDAARVAASQGALSARFHYAGTGESDGNPLDLTLESMIADTLAVVEHLRSEHEAARTVLVGIRLGAAVALRAAEMLGDVAGLMLIEPVQKGRTYVSRAMTRKRIRKMVTEAEDGGSQAKGEHIGADEETEVVDFDGHPISPAQRASLEALDLPAGDTPVPAPVLILEIAGRERTSKAAEELSAALTARGACVATRTMVTEPFWNSLGVVSLPDLTAAIAGFVADPEGCVARLAAGGEEGVE